MDSRSPATNAAQWTLRDARIWLVPILAGIYLVAGKLGLILAFVHPSATAVWAPTGIALAAYLMLGYRVWPGVFLGAFFVNVTTAGSLATSLGIATGNTLEGLAGAYLVNRFARGRAAFQRPIDLFKFAGLAGLLAPTVSASIGVTSLALGGYADRSGIPSIWLTWWLGDVAGAIIVTPVIVLWAAKPGVRWNRARVVEAAVLLACLVATGTLVFGGWIPHAYPFMCVPPIIWIAFRLGTRETATAVLVLLGLALSGTLRGFGPFAQAPSGASLLLLQGFVGMIGLTGLTLAAAVTERAGIERLLRKSEEEHRAIAALTTDFAAISRFDDGKIVLESVTDGFSLVTGYTRAELELRGGWPALMHPEDRVTAATAIGDLLAGGRFTGDLRIVTKSGQTRWLRYFSRPFSDPGEVGGSARRLLTAAQDITDRKQAEATLAKQQEAIRVLSTPVLPVRDRLLILPVIGEVDPARARQLTKHLVEGIRTHRARAVVLDLTGVADIDPAAANHLVQTVETARLMGATVILSGLSAGITRRLVAIGIDVSRLRTAGDLQAGLDDAQRLLLPSAPK